MARQAKSAVAEAPPPSDCIQELIDLAGVNDALRELGELDHRQAAYQAALDRQNRAAAQEFAGKLFTTVAGERVSFADRRARLESQITAYAQAHRDEICADGKSVKLNHGVIGFRQAKASLSAVPGSSAAGSATMLDKIKDALMAVLTAFPCFKRVQTSAFVKLAITFDKPALLKAFTDRQISETDLAKVGFQYDEPTDNPFFKPAEVILTDHPASATP